MYSKKYSSIGLLLVLAMIFSMVAVMLPAEPALAAASPTVISPSTASPEYVRPQSTVSVSFVIGSSDNGTYSCQAFMVQGSTSYSSVGANISDDGSLQTQLINVPVGAPTGFYYVYVAAGGTNSTNVTNAIYVDNTAPTLSVAIPNASTCWQGGTVQNIQWSASDAASTDNVTVFSYISTDSGASYAHTAVYNLALAQGAQLGSIAVPAATSSTCKLWMFARDRAGNASDNVTTSLFSIYNAGPAPVVVTSPNGGESYNGGSSQTVTGTITGIGTTVQYLISLSTDNGASWTENITASWQTGTLSGGVYNVSYPWTVSNNVHSTNCLVRIQSKYCAGPLTADTSNAAFTIADVTVPTVTVTAPATGNTWYGGAVQNITWTQTDNIVGNLASSQLYYTTDGSTYFLIGGGTVTQGVNNYAWTVPAATTSSNCKVKVVVTDGAGNSTTAYSGTFSISPGGVPSVTLCTPNGAENWQVGSTQAITWTCSDSLDPTARMTYLIQLSTDSGATWPTTIATLSNQTQATACGGSHSWAVSDNASATAMVKITATNGAGASASDQSNAVFTITASTCAVETANVALTAGWNLISLPINPTNTNIDSMLSSVMANVISVWYYSNGTWYSYAPGAPSTLTALEAGKAYWINASAPCTLSFQGRKCPCPPSSPTTFAVSNTGWNMIGFKSTVNKTVATYFASLGTCGTAYLAPINGYAAGAWTSINCTDNMTPGSGYWVYINSTGQINPGCD